MLRMMTSDETVIGQAAAFMPWLLLMPVIGCAAFTWDGIYIGATASKEIRNAMLWAVVACAGVWLAGMACLDHIPAIRTEIATQTSAFRHDVLAMHILMAAYFAHLLARTIYLSAKYSRIKF